MIWIEVTHCGARAHKMADIISLFMLRNNKEMWNNYLHQWNLIKIDKQFRR